MHNPLYGVQNNEGALTFTNDICCYPIIVVIELRTKLRRRKCNFQGKEKLELSKILYNICQKEKQDYKLDQAVNSITASEILIPVADSKNYLSEPVEDDASYHIQLAIAT